jgi:hypothetical protein
MANRTKVFGLRPNVGDGEKERGTRGWSKMTCDRYGDTTFQIHLILIAIAHAMILGLWAIATGIGSGYPTLRPKVGEGEKIGDAPLKQDGR